MGALDLDQAIRGLSLRGSDVVSPPQKAEGARSFGEGVTSSVLGLVSEAAASIRQREQKAANAVARAHHAAKAVRQQLQSAETRADRAETTLRRTQDELAELTARVAQAHKDVELLDSYIAAREAELSAAQNRADRAEKRGAEAEATIRKILEALRREFPVDGAGQL